MSHALADRPIRSREQRLRNPQQAFVLSRMPDSAAALNIESLDAVIESIWRDNPQVRGAVAQIKAAQFEIAGAQAGYYPYVAVNSAQGSNDASNTSLRLVQPIWSGGRVGAEVDETRAERRVALAELGQTRLDIALEAVEAYLNAARAREQAVRWDEYVAGLTALLEVIRRRADLGVSPPVDVQTALSRLRQAQAQRQANQSDLTENRSRLISLLGREPGPASWPGAGDRLTPAEVRDSYVNGGVVLRHPARLRALAEIDAAQARVKSSRAMLWPELSLQRREQISQARGDFTPESSTQLVFQFQSNNGLQGYRGAQAAQQRAASAREELATVQRDIANRIRSARSNREAAEAEFYARVASAQATTRLVNSFLRQFKVGRKAWVDVLNALQESNQALQQIAANKQNYWVANYRLIIEGMLWDEIVREPVSSTETSTAS